MPEDWKPSGKYNDWLGCAECQHFAEGICVAYPRGIPILIGSGEVDHMVKRPGQTGETLFEPKEAAAEEEKLQGLPVRPPPVQMTVERDAAGRVLRMIGVDGIVKTVERDELGRIIRIIEETN